MKALQKFDREYLEQCKNMSPLEILEFLENFRTLHGAKSVSKTKLISIKVEEDLLSAFRKKADLMNTPYQTQIKKLMRQWLGV
jgi:predicted DNA binding CopG/RHH family protein